jgi:hypothetical protein
MASMLATATIPSRDNERDAFDLARLDDDGGRRRSEDSMTLTLRVAKIPATHVDDFPRQMIPGAREPGRQVTFGVEPVIIGGSPSTMDAATIASRQREGGGAPNQRRRPGDRTLWARWVRRLRHFFAARDRSADSTSTLSHK